MKKKANKPKSTQQATELRDKITRIILNGKGIRRRIKENLDAPVKFTADDGVFYDPKWQDEFLDYPRENDRFYKARIRALLERIDREKLIKAARGQNP